VKPFDSVVIGSARDTFAEAQAMRAALESYLLNVHLYWFRQKRNLMDFLAGRVAEADYVVLCCHGTPSVEGDLETTRLRVHNLVEEIDGRWESATVNFSADDIRATVRLPGRTVITQGCGTGVEPIARAFLDAGCRAYIGPIRPADQDAGPLFVSALFYFLLRPNPDPRVEMTERRAAQLSANIDTLSLEGTHLFRYYEAADLSRPTAEA
jgi:hypothetical protein